MTSKIEFEQAAEKELRGLDRQQAARILKYLFERIAHRKTHAVLEKH